MAEVTPHEVLSCPECWAGEFVVFKFGEWALLFQCVGCGYRFKRTAAVPLGAWGPIDDGR